MPGVGTRSWVLAAQRAGGGEPPALRFDRDVEREQRRRERERKRTRARRPRRWLRWRFRREA